MSEIKNVSSSFLSILQEALDSTYYKQPIPSYIDNMLNKIIDRFNTDFRRA
jgi:hypothetical protein